MQEREPREWLLPRLLSPDPAVRQTAYDDTRRRFATNTQTWLLKPIAVSYTEYGNPIIFTAKTNGEITKGAVTANAWVEKIYVK